MEATQVVSEKTPQTDASETETMRLEALRELTALELSLVGGGTIAVVFA